MKRCNYSQLFLSWNRLIIAKCWRAPQTWRPMCVRLHRSPLLLSSVRRWRKFTLKSAPGHWSVTVSFAASDVCMLTLSVFILRYYGCGLVVPESLEGCRILDLGSGSGRDCYMLSQLVGENGHVTGIDMTDDQVHQHYSVASVHSELSVIYVGNCLQTKLKNQKCCLCSLLAWSGQDTCGLSHERVWLQEAQFEFCPGFHWGPNRSGFGKELIWHHHVRTLSCLFLFCFWMLFNFNCWNVDFLP